ncbi:MAG: hypothetical protein AAF684_04170 [Pseudomonadota bacterium]
MRAAAAPAPRPAAPIAANPAGQSAQARAADAAPSPTRLTLTAESDPSLLPRALETILRRGATPCAVDAQLGADGWRIALTVDGLLDTEIAHVAAVLAGLVGVRAVTVENAAPSP